MTISTLLMILALAVGGANQAIAGDPEPDDARPKGKIENNCWINGVYYTPCPAGDPGPDPPPIFEPPT
jgi:hypothetical protein